MGDGDTRTSALNLARRSAVFADFVRRVRFPGAEAEVLVVVDVTDARDREAFEGWPGDRDTEAVAGRRLFYATATHAEAAAVFGRWGDDYCREVLSGKVHRQPGDFPVAVLAGGRLSVALLVLEPAAPVPSAN